MWQMNRLEPSPSPASPLGAVAGACDGAAAAAACALATGSGRYIRVAGGAAAAPPLAPPAARFVRPATDGCTLAALLSAVAGPRRSLASAAICDVAYASQFTRTKQK
jgi:hypothetical protein